MEKKQWRDTWYQGWHNVWSEVCDKLPPRKEHRETFELLVAVLIYQFNAIEELSDEALHDFAAGLRVEYKPEEYEAQLQLLFNKSKWPRFSTEGKKPAAKYYCGTMHFASASFRLSTALYLIARNLSSPLSHLLNKNKDDWDRKNKLYEYLKKAQEDTEKTEKKRCPNILTINPNSDPESFSIYLSMIVAHRDEFGHGEQGGARGNWRTDREKYYRKLLRCSIVEAQLNLIQSGVSSLRRA